MKRTAKKAFSLIELLMVISVVAILASLLLVSLASAKARSRQAACVNNLHQIGLGFTGFALDHEGKYQMEMPERLGGSLEYNDSQLITNTPFSRDFHHFAVLSNEVPNVKIMVCPGDHTRRAAKNYQTFINDNLSYWANTKALPHATLSTFAGDWNIHNTGASSNVENLAFGPEVHRQRGSVLFADGRVEITRTLTVAIPVSPEPTAVTKPNPPPPTTAAGAPKARQQPTSIAPTPAAPPPSAPTVNSTPAPNATDTAPSANSAPGTNENAKASATVSSQGRFGSSRRIGPVGNASDPAPVGYQIRQEATVGSGPEPANDAEPWDTPGFRIFKLFAFLSYLISLLWAIIALLILYLRSRLAQRERERAEAVTSD